MFFLNNYILASLEMHFLQFNTKRAYIGGQLTALFTKKRLRTPPTMVKPSLNSRTQCKGAES